MKVKAFIAVIVASCCFIAVSIAQEDNSALLERIKPVGKLQIAGAAPPQAAVAAGPRSGKDIYAGACTACHAIGVLGAPKTQVSAEWQPRLDEKGFDQVWKNAIDGIGAMPPMGACGDCTDDDIKAAIEYMIEGI
ncbi:cytochrome c5 [Glaciecola punicea ACAM 611]|uniref:Cytochrome c5 n=1 Tax=Glaciecola punicea ACAM 611 TaxID=1121923 RepID=H5TCX2_9ALTE|nr:cytochrome C [Glaciecola punicea]GAB56149.1 cytochrome c5 [Glaciecola punicea ACAM 611]